MDRLQGGCDVCWVRLCPKVATNARLDSLPTFAGLLLDSPSLRTARVAVFEPSDGVRCATRGRVKRLDKEGDFMHVELQTPQGPVRGWQRANYQAFLGLPYAAAPVAERRFAAPGPAPTWTTRRDALQFGAVAPQPYRAAMTAHGEQGEDCLFLNIFTPAADGRRRPVLFWIHGGGFSNGAGSEPTYDGGALAVRGDVVVVTINYRLGALGYLYLAEHGGAAWDAATNAGQRDQLAALRWVRDNIAAYGGDPAQVTVFGESAGAVAISALLVTPDAEGLFVRAIVQSGTANRMGALDVAKSVTQAFLAHVGCEEAERERLRAFPVAEILAAQEAAARPHAGTYWPVVDGRQLPQRPIAAVREGRARHIPLLLGTTRDETKLFAASAREPLDDSELAERVRAHVKEGAQVPVLLATYRASRLARGLPRTNHDILDAIDTSLRFTVPATRLAEAYASHQPATYMYMFDWESPVKRLGACHALELPFVFGTLSAPGNDRFAGVGPAAERLSEQMMDAWIAFARTGDPSCPAVGTWPRYEAGERQTMIFGKQTHVAAAPFEEERAFWSKVF